MASTIINVTQIRDNLSEILGRVKFGSEVVTIEKKGKPYAVIISPEEYERYKEAARKAFAATIASIQAKNVGVDEKELMEDVTKEVEAVRQEMYERRK